MFDFLFKLRRLRSTQKPRVQSTHEKVRRCFLPLSASGADAAGGKKQRRTSRIWFRTYFMSDEELLIALSEGVNESLDQLFARHGGRVLNYCAKRGLSQEQAQDVTQIVFLQVFRKKHLYDPKHPALAWLYIITKSELRDWRKKELRHQPEILADLSQIGEIDPISFEDEEQVETLLSELSPKEKEALKLRYLEELDYPEIAKRLKQSESNIRQIVSRALRFLKLKHGSKE